MTIGNSLGPGGKQPELQGVGGWLAFLCVSLLFLYPLSTMINLLARWREVLTAPELLIDWVILLGFVGFGILAGIRLSQVHPKALRLAKTYFIARIVWGVLVVAAYALEDLEDPAIAARAFLSLIQSVAIPVLWLIYLYRSQRVRVTFSRPLAASVSDVFR